LGFNFDLNFIAASDLSVKLSSFGFVFKCTFDKICSMNKEYKLERDHFSILTFEEADQEFNDYQALSWQERFRIHQHLNSIVYGYAGHQPPAMDRTVFSCGKLNDGQHIS